MRLLSTGCKPERFFNAVAEAPGRALLLDYDGTLAPFRKRRDEARPYPGVVAALDDLLVNRRCRVVLVSGRATADLLPLLGLAITPEIWGSHGRERLMPDGKREWTPLTPAVATALERATDWVRELGIADSWEIKPAGIALHWRGLPPGDARDLERRAREYWDPMCRGGGLAVNSFDGGIELTATGQNKGDAVSAILDEMHPATVAAYLGDDATDEDAFDALQRRNSGHALAVLVRDELRPTQADWWLRPPEELLEFLNNWRSACVNRDKEEAPTSVS